MYKSLLNKPESYRKKVAIFSSVFVFMLIIGVWTNVKGFWVDSTPRATAPVAKEEEKTSVALSANKATKPTQAVSRSFSGSFGELANQFNSLKESLASVFVPFITGIEVYDSSEK